MVTTTATTATATNMADAETADAVVDASIMVQISPVTNAPDSDPAVAVATVDIAVVTDSDGSFSGLKGYYSLLLM